MFNSRYEYIPLEDLIVIYFEKLDKYKKEIEDAFFRQLTRIKTINYSGRYMLESYEDTMKRIDQKRFKEYEYVIDRREGLLKLAYSYSLIMKQIYQNIYEREQDGISQDDVKMKLHQFFQGTPTHGGLKLFKELVAEANTQLGLLKLSEIYSDQKEIVYR